MRKLFKLSALASLALLVACSDSDPLDDPTSTGEAIVESAFPANDDVNDAPTLVNIVDTAVAAGSFNTLAAALEATDLISTLADESGTFTVFAPNDEAFANLGEESINALLADPDTLRDILLYHVVPGAAVDAATALSLAGSTVTTANEDDIALTLNDDRLFVNMSEVIATDIQASNGIIHVIDTVLIPPTDTPADAITGSIVETAIAAGSFTTLVAALQATGLDATLANTDDTFTVFAPTDEAFAQLGDDTINALLEDPETLAGILLYHVIGGQAVDSVTAISLAGNNVATANGADISISVSESQLFINDAQVITADVATSNGIIHAIDTVLMPPAADSDSGTDDGDGTNVPDANAGTLLDIARGNPDFSTLVAAIEATGLDAALGHPDDTYTVFAPNNAAFAALGDETINTLLNDPDTLRDILLFHVLPGTVVDAASAVSLVGTSIETGNGSRFALRVDGESLFINDSQIIATDIFGVNGVIHVIDAVLIPNN